MPRTRDACVSPFLTPAQAGLQHKLRSEAANEAAVAALHEQHTCERAALEVCKHCRTSSLRSRAHGTELAVPGSAAVRHRV